jgi:cobalamin biosynthetic protein CobC
MNSQKREHGGGLDAAMARYGGGRSDWVDLSTGINPVPYPLPQISAHSWSALPDEAAQDALIDAARKVWNVPSHAAVLAAPGASALIAAIPSLRPATSACIPEPTYNEHRAAFVANAWKVDQELIGDARVLVHPNNPTGRFWTASDADASFTVIDESFCDVAPDRSLVHLADRPGKLVLKSFGKFWGLAGLRLGFAIGDPALIGILAERLGPWPVAGPALEIGARALSDTRWANETRSRLNMDAKRLDTLMIKAGADVQGGTSLFRLYKVDDAKAWQDRLATHHVWSRSFTYDSEWLRLGLPAPERWPQVASALS